MFPVHVAFQSFPGESLSFVHLVQELRHNDYSSFLVGNYMMDMTTILIQILFHILSKLSLLTLSKP